MWGMRGLGLGVVIHVTLYIVHSNIVTYYVEVRWGDSDVVIHVTSTLADADWEVKEI